MWPSIRRLFLLFIISQFLSDIKRWLTTTLAAVLKFYVASLAFLRGLNSLAALTKLMTISQ